MASRILRRIAQHGTLGRAVALLERLDSSSPRILRVLTYHRVDEAEPFARQMESLAVRYRPVSIARVLVALDGGPSLPPRAVLLTFDDAYRSFAEVAWPILRRHAFPATLFVPTAFPDRPEPRFWWDRLEQAFARTARRTPWSSPVGLLPLASEEERARAHALVKRHVKDLAHAATLAVTGEVCAALGHAPEAHEVLGWDELRSLAREGVTLGAHTRTHPRLDRISRAEARAELLGSVRELEREVPGQPRVFAYPDGRFDDGLVELARAAGIELAFTTRRGTNDLRTSDRLRLRRIHLDARDSVEVLHAKLALSAARLERATRLFDPPSAAERRAERAARREHRRTRVYLRSLDAVLTAGLRPGPGDVRGLFAVRASHYERVRSLVRVAEATLPALEPRLARALLDPSRLPFHAPRPRLVGYGSGTTVFRLEGVAPGAPARALKIYRRTLGRAPARLVGVARRNRLRYRQLSEAFGEVVLPAEFLVLHAPLRGTPAVACLQPWLEGALADVFAFTDDQLLARVARQDGLAQALAAFARRALEWHARGTFPDLLGPENLVLVEERGRTRLRLIDYGIFRAEEAPSSAALVARVATLARRLAAWLARLEPERRENDVLAPR